ncbi:hypothetical protein [Erythrobacter sp. EC-HK427]|uniref:hypothetical protein n=1 Tax=Erythrobacter sp. EC-HK427 TaxID=2038396 RepID=UPI001256EDCF|nr:hypothetical protein [Erythrobacter sp. EC-HK427]VVT18115.1 conserved hypothetical protein [Erythrobacter sp. EC-HK427]
MGGYGSGRQGGRPIAEHCLRIDFGFMLRKGFVAPGAWRNGTLRWSSGGQPSGDISYSCDMRDPENSRLELRYSVVNHLTGDRKQQIQNIRLSYTVPKFGGKRWWMHCPVSGARVGQLYLPPGGELFASRKVWRIGYRSQRVPDHEKPFEALFRLQRRLGCAEGWAMPIRRPKGMHHSSFGKLEERYWQLDHHCAQVFAGMEARLGGLGEGIADASSRT